MRRTADDWVRAGARRWLRSGVAAAAGRAGGLGASLAWIGGRCGAAPSPASAFTVLAAVSSTWQHKNPVFCLGLCCHCLL